MPQDLQTPAAVPDSSVETQASDATGASRSPESQQFSANTYAARLMDDLFQDVERLLDLDAPSPVTPDPTPAALEPVAEPFPATPFPPTEVRATVEPGMPLATRSEAIVLPAMPAVEPDSLAEMQPVTAAVLTPTVTTPPVQRTWNRLLLALGCVSVVLSLGLWVLYLESKQRQQVAGVTPTGSSAYSQADQKFADYLQKSLQHINPQAQPGMGEPAQTSHGGVKVPGMPSVAVPQTNAPAPLATNPNDPKRVYVPIYQLPTNLYPPGSAIAPLPQPPQPGKPTSRPAPPKTTADAPGVLRRLVGVLEQGENSVALIEINGVTQRYELGESIGSSGWTLVEVSKNQAIIRRNGDVRSLLVGHSF